MNDVVQNIIHFVVTFLFSLIFLMADRSITGRRVRFRLSST